MIKIKVEYDGKIIKNFKITGHANYDVHGKDIVCASVSSIVITSCNMALSFDSNSIEFIQKDGLISVNILKYDDIINKIFTNMINMLEELSKDYERNVKII